MKKIIIALCFFSILVSCRTTNIFYPVQIIQTTPEANGMEWFDDDVSFAFDLNDAFWRVAIHNKTNENMSIMWDNALINVSDYGNNAEKQTQKTGESGKSHVMPNSKISKLLYARHAVRKHVYVPKDVSKFGNRYVNVLIPVEVAGKIKEYVFSFVISINNARKYSDELYTIE